MTEERSTVIPGHRYRNAAAAIAFLTEVFGFVERAVYKGEDGSIVHAELALGGGMIMLGSVKDDEYGRGFKSPEELAGIETRGVYLVIGDVDAAYARAQSAGAKVVRALQETAYDSREFTVKDPEGHSWSAGTYNPWAPHS